MATWYERLARRALGHRGRGGWLRAGLNRLDLRRSFGKRLGLTIAAIVLLFSLLLASTVGTISQAQVKATRGEFLAQLAYQLAWMMDQNIYSYYQLLQTVATLEEMQDVEHGYVAQRQRLGELQSIYEGLSWVGLVTPRGQVLASTQSVLEGENVAGQLWFETGKERPTVQDAHPGEPLTTLVANSNANPETVRFVDVSTPVFNAQGEVVAVLGAHLHSYWSTLLRHHLLRPIQRERQVEIFITARNGDILLEPSATSEGKNLSYLPSFTAAHRGQMGFGMESWDNHNAYLVGYAPTQGYQDYAGIGWVVLVRQPTDYAFASARSLMYSILIWGIVLGLVSGTLTWWLSEQMVKPVIAIAATAKRMRQGDRSIAMPVLTGRDEIAQLSRSVAQLFANLEQQRSLLQSFNIDLERQVADRTASLSALNHQLRQEIDVRQRAETALQQANQELQRLTLLDGLTGVINRRGFDQYLDQSWHQARRSLAPLSLLLLDVDHFKAYNDHYGHPAGDGCLQQAAQAIQHAIHRPTDRVARYGGEEFAVILPNTDAAGARHLAEQFRQAVQNLALPHAHSTAGDHVSVSIGAATVYPDSLTVPQDLIAMADHHLYRAKQQGRNRVVGPDHPTTTRQPDEIGGP